MADDDGASGPKSRSGLIAEFLITNQHEPHREFQHVEFAGGELVQAVSLIWRPGAGPLRAVLDQAPGNGRERQRVSRHGSADSGDELVCGRGLEQESAGPAVQRFKDIFVEIEGGEKYDSRDGIPGG